MASSYNPRYELARLLNEQRAVGGYTPRRPGTGVVPSQAGVRLGRTAADLSLRYPSLKSAVQGIQRGEQAKDKGVLAGIFNNPIAKVTLKGLEAFTVLGRGTVAGIREAVDALDSDSKTKASFSDFVNNTKDPSFGFGKAFKIDTGSKWLDRAIGFVGDVALDPLTYATFGASAGVSAVGAAGRANLAARVLANTGDDALATAIAREGRRALRGRVDAAEVLEAAGANRYGVYFFGKRVNVGANGRGLRVPLSGHIGEIGEATLSRIRLGITDSKLYDKIARMTIPKSQLSAVRALSKPGLAPSTGAGLIRILDATPVQRGRAAAMRQALEQEVASIVDRLEADGVIDGARKTVHRFLENPELLPEATPAELAAYNTVKDFLARVKTSLEGEWLAFDENAYIGFVENYFPRTLSDEAMAWLRSSPSKEAQQARKVFLDDPFSTPDAFTPRSLRKGREFFGHVLKKEDLNVQSLNEIARKGGFQGDFFTTDVVEALTRYASDAADEFGILARNMHLKESGFFKLLDDQKVVQTGVDADDVKMATNLVEEAANSVKGAERALADTAAALRNTLDSELAAASAGAKSLEESALEIVTVISDGRTALNSALEEVDDAALRLANLQGAYDTLDAALVSDAFPQAMRPLLNQYSGIKQELSTYLQKMADAQAQLDSVTAVDIGASRAVRDKLAAELETLSKSVADYGESIRRGLERNNVLAEQWDSISSGGNIVGLEDSLHAWLKDIKDVLGSGRATEASATALKKQRQVLGVGSWKVWRDSADAKDVVREFGGSGKTAIRHDKVSRISQKQFEERLNRSLTEAVSARELRELAVYAIMRDTHMWGGEVPAEVRLYWDELIDSVRRTEDAERVAAIKAGRVQNTSLDLFEMNWNPLKEDADNLLADIEEKRSIIDVLEGMASSDATVLDAPFDRELARTLTGAVKEGLKARGVNPGQAKIAPFFFDILDNSDRIVAQTGRDGLTVADVLNAAKSTESVLMEDFDRPLYVVGQGKLKRGDAPADKTVYSPRQMMEVYPRKRAAAGGVSGEMRAAGLGGRGTGSVTYAGRQRVAGEMVATVDDAKFELASSLSKYAAISDATTKFSALAMILAQDGMVPTEEMWRGILKSVSQHHSGRYKAGAARSIEAERILTEFRDAFNAAWKETEARNLKVDDAFSVTKDVVREEGPVLPGGVRRGKMGNQSKAVLNRWNKKPSDVFSRLWADLMNQPDADYVAEVVGPTFAQMVDPGQLRRTLAQMEKEVREKVPGAKDRLDTFVKSVVAPWARSIDPSISAKTRAGAVDLLKSRAGKSRQAVRANMNPFNPDATPRTVANWFDEIFDTADSTVRVDVASAGTAGVVVPQRRGLIAKQRERYREMENFFIMFEDPFVDPSDILLRGGSSADTPSWFGLQMQHLADDLADILDTNRFDPRGIYRRSVTQSEEVSRSVARATTARAVVDEMAGETKGAARLTAAQRATRDAVMEHKKFMASGWYAKAKNDEDIVRFLRAAAGIDMSRFDEGIVVGTERVPMYRYKVKPQEMSSFADTRVEKRMVAREAERQKAIISRGLTEDFTDEDVVALRAQLEEIDRGVKEQFRQIDARAAEGNQQAVREARKVSMAEGPTEFEDRPKFFTYDEIAPNGSTKTTRLVFSRPEWDSLYSKPVSAGELGQSRARIAAVDREIETLGTQIERTQSRVIAPLQRELTTVEESIAAARAVRDIGLKPKKPKTFVGDKPTTEARRRWAAQQRGLNYDRIVDKKVLDSVYAEELRSVTAEYNRSVRSWDRARSASAGKTDVINRLERTRRKLIEDLSKATDGIQGPQLRLKTLTTERGNLLYIISMNEPGVREAALFKVRKLIGGNGREFAGTEWVDNLIESWSGVTDTKPNFTLTYYAKQSGESGESALKGVYNSAALPTADRRLAVIDELWDKNPSKRTIIEAQRLADAANTEAYREGLASVDMHVLAARTASKAAVESRKSLGRVERSVLEAVDQMRRAELGAVRAAGGEVVEPGTKGLTVGGKRRGPFSFGEDMVRRVATPRGMFGREAGMTADEVAGLSGIRRTASYTFRGQTYEVPSLEQILSDPQKYIAQFRERANMFRGLKPEVEPAMLTQADDAARQAFGLTAIASLSDTVSKLDDGIRVAGERAEELRSLISAWAGDAMILQAGLKSYADAIVAEKRLALEALNSATGNVDRVYADFYDRMNSIAALYDEQLDMASTSAVLARRRGLIASDADLPEVEQVMMSRVANLQGRANALRNIASQLEAISKASPDAASLAGSRKLTGAAKDKALETAAQFAADTDGLLGSVARQIADKEDGWTLWSALVRAQLAEGRFMQEQLRLGQAQAALEAANVPKIVEKIIKPYQRGYKQAAEKYLADAGLVQTKTLRAPSYGADAGAMEILSSMQRLNDGAVVRDFAKFISGYTGFFKAYATLTPGFHVRNAISNAFQIFAGGGEARNMGRALNTYRSFADAVKDVVKFDEWDAAVQRWLATVPEADRAAAEMAYGVSVALQGGNVSEAFREISKMKKGVLTDNFATRFSRKTGHRVEGSARFIMAFDAAKRGMDYNSAYNHTRRFLFDYHDPTILDETVRNIIPFWTWMSRNLPLQITNQWLNPKPYVLYAKFAKNFRAEDREDMPEWMRRQNPLALGGGFVITPDLPMNNIEKQVKDLANPGQWLEYINPALRVPVELMAGRKAFSGAPIDGFAPVDGALRPFIPLLEALGQIERGPNGEPVISQSAKYALESLIPTIGQTSRLFPSTDGPAGKRVSTTARYFGLPLQAWGPEQADNETIGRLRALQELAQRQRQIREASQ